MFLNEEDIYTKVFNALCRFMEDVDEIGDDTEALRTALAQIRGELDMAKYLMHDEKENKDAGDDE